VRLRNGQNAVFEVLNEAKEQYEVQKHMQALSIDISTPSVEMEVDEDHGEDFDSSDSKLGRTGNMAKLKNKTSTGKRSIVENEIIYAALQDGSSGICRNCHGVISRERADAHFRMWCPALPDKDDI
jgi:hypothetical protein